MELGQDSTHTRRNTEHGQKKMRPLKEERGWRMMERRKQGEIGTMERRGIF